MPAKHTKQTKHTRQTKLNIQCQQNMYCKKVLSEQKVQSQQSFVAATIRQCPYIGYKCTLYMFTRQD